MSKLLDRERRLDSLRREARKREEEPAGASAVATLPPPASAADPPVQTLPIAPPAPPSQTAPAEAYTRPSVQPILLCLLAVTLTVYGVNWWRMRPQPFDAIDGSSLPPATPPLEPPADAAPIINEAPSSPAVPPAAAKPVEPAARDTARVSEAMEAALQQAATMLSAASAKKNR